MLRAGKFIKLPIPLPERESRLGLIEGKLTDPDFKADEIARYISMEMVRLIIEMEKCSDGCDPREQARCRRPKRAIFNALRELNKQTREASMARKREDTLNLKGPKFLFVLREIAKLLQDVLKEVGIENSQGRNIIMQLADAVRLHEERIEHQLKQMDR